MSQRATPVPTTTATSAEAAAAAAATPVPAMAPLTAAWWLLVTISLQSSYEEFVCKTRFIQN